MAHTHQTIADRREQLLRELMAAGNSARVEAEKPYRKDLESLQGLCGDLGHVFVKFDPSWNILAVTRRMCAACGKEDEDSSQQVVTSPISEALGRPIALCGGDSR